MTEEMYLYKPSGYSPGYVYRNFDDALAQFVKDCDEDTIEDVIRECKKWGAYTEYSPENCSVYIDDGGSIERIEVR